MNRFAAALPALIAVLVLVSGCATDVSPTTTNVAATPLFAVSEVGGCSMMGPNCTTRLLWSDGTVTVYRQPAIELPLSGLAALVPDAVDMVDPSVPEAVALAIASSDLDQIVAGLPWGACNACIDGIDFVVVMATSDGDFRINSAEKALDPTVPLIAELNNAAVAMGQGTALPILNG